MVVKCTNQECKRDIKLKKHAFKCIHCKEKCEIFIPEETQILEIHYIDAPCEMNCSKEEKKKRKKCDKFYFLKCAERFHHSTLHPGELLFRCNKCKLLFHAVLIRGRRSVCLIQTNEKDCLLQTNKRIPASPLHILAVRFGRLFEEITLRIHTISGGCKPFLIYGRARRLGEIILPFFVMLLCFIFYLCIFILFDRYQYIPIVYSVFVSVADASLIYFSFLVLKETVIVLGEIELKSFQDFARGMYDCFFTFRKIWFLIGLMFTLILLVDEILEFGFRPPATEVEKIRWIENIARIPDVFIFNIFNDTYFLQFWIISLWNVG